ncbi:hypothetical protein BpHYR1_051759 [Brachionus plicatilis]|uniref:Uncharacterized protein n=1 Tax=Brachionus plicatilis TaxID=10195 RepID=A0A3M7P3P8_BRAPC|nr:hypothetical protein BpHYR1_051759 [Brachionus plicatilis]
MLGHEVVLEFVEYLNGPLKLEFLKFEHLRERPNEELEIDYIFMPSVTYQINPCEHTLVDAKPIFYGPSGCTNRMINLSVDEFVNLHCHNKFANFQIKIKLILFPLRVSIARERAGGPCFSKKQQLKCFNSNYYSNQQTKKGKKLKNVHNETTAYK